MPTHQIWLCHVTQVANFEVFYFVLILHLILMKIAKFLMEKLHTLKLSITNFTREGEPPVPLGLKSDSP